MDVSLLIRTARLGSGLTLRELASAAGTSHSTIAAYEAGRKSPNVATLDRILRAAGYASDIHLTRRHRDGIGGDKGEELAAVLELAAQFPARHSPTLEAPVFTRVQ